MESGSGDQKKKVNIFFDVELEADYLEHLSAKGEVHG